MKKNTFALSVATACLLGTSTFALQNALPDCPIMGEPINLAISTPTEDGPVYFCCKGCVKRFNQDPGKYAKDAADQRKALAKREKIQVKCPVSGEAVDGKVTIEHNGETVAFCCGGCVGKFKSNPSKYQAALANSYTLQTVCPVMGERIKPNVYTTLANGQNVYYCCKGCEKKLLKNPKKYAPKLAEQGYTISPKHLVKAGHDHDHGHGHHHGHGHGHGHHDHDHGGK